MASLLTWSSAEGLDACARVVETGETAGWVMDTGSSWHGSIVLLRSWEKVSWPDRLLGLHFETRAAAMRWVEETHSAMTRAAVLDALRRSAP